MSPLRERLTFAATLAILVAGFLGESLFGGKVLSPADVVYAQTSFQDGRHGPLFEPLNRLLIDPVLQFQPWLEFNRRMIRSGRLPLWNPYQGCGAPHLANGQSAVFDPFHAIAYLGALPTALAPMAAARLWVAGFGMFLLAARWRLGPWGRWFAGLAFPFTGFLIVWLQYPVTSVAVWLPWLLLATDCVLEEPCLRNLALLSLATGVLLLAGHIQTSAHLLIAAGLFACWRCRSLLATAFRRVSARTGSRAFRRQEDDRKALVSPVDAETLSDPPATSIWRPLVLWATGVSLGVAIGAVAVVPLGFYLSRSPVWADRASARPSVWAVERPRLLDAACTALPYLYGSQRRGHPNLAKALGVHNLNESAGGFAGLATLLWLAPVGFGARNDRSRFLTFLILAGAFASFQAPIFANLLRAVPIINVADNRRLTLWVAFGLVMLAGMGLDRLADWRPTRWTIGWISGWLVAASALIVTATLVPRTEASLRGRALANQQKNIAEGSVASARMSADRVERQVHQTIHFAPRYCYWAAAHLSAIAILATAAARRAVSPAVARTSATALVLADLVVFGYGLNPAIARADERPTNALITYLQREAAPPARALAIGAELPPNVLMRYGIADVRNYDSIELTRNLEWFAPLFEPGRSRTSRRTITWAGVVRTIAQLRAANVTAIVGATPPPANIFDRVDRVNGVWIARLAAPGRAKTRENPNEITVDVASVDASKCVVAESYDPGWRAEIDGAPTSVAPESETFLSVMAPRGARTVRLVYDPVEVRWAVRVSATALTSAVAILVITILQKARRKTFRRAWSARNDRVRIDTRDLRRFSSPASHGTEGRDADGPLHV
jgi:hypothetical protein